MDNGLVQRTGKRLKSPVFRNEVECLTLDPASNDKIGTLPELTRAETADAISHALTAFQSFRNTIPRERARLLRKWFDLCQTHSSDLAKIITWENGKPFAEAKGEVMYGSSFIEWFSEEAPRVYGDVIPSSIKGNRIITLRQPIGVVGIITPWNFPMGMPRQLCSDGSNDYQESWRSYRCRVYGSNKTCF